MGIIRNSIVWVEVTPTMDTNAFAAGDLWIDSTSLGVISAYGGEPVILQSLVIVDEDDQAAAAATLFFKNASTTLGTVNNALNVSDAVSREIVGMIPILAGDWVDIGGSKMAYFSDLGMVIKPASTGQCWIAGSTGGSPTQTATGVKLRMGFIG